MKKLTLLGAAVLATAIVAPGYAQQGMPGPGGPYGLTPDAPGYYYNDGYRYHRGFAPFDAAAGVAAGAVGTAGAIATAPFRGPGGAYAMMPGDDSYCAQRYRSYDPASGTFLGRDGRRHPCR